MHEFKINGGVTNEKEGVGFRFHFSLFDLVIRNC